MKFYDDFSSMFNAQSGKQSMSVFNIVNDISSESFFHEGPVAYRVYVDGIVLCKVYGFEDDGSAIYSVEFKSEDGEEFLKQNYDEFRDFVSKFFSKNRLKDYSGSFSNEFIGAKGCRSRYSFDGAPAKELAWRIDNNWEDRFRQFLYEKYGIND